jgi:hypothetical protein
MAAAVPLQAAVPLVQPLAPAAAPSSLAGLRALEEALPEGQDADPGPAIDSFWDASGQTAAGAVFPEGESGVQAFLASPRAGDKALVADMTAAARLSPTGRRVLDAAFGLVRARGEPVQVRLKDLKGNLGTYDYIHRVLYIDRGLARKAPRAAAVTLVHELVHILQHAEGLPAEALEMELEAHIVTLKVMAELGIPLAPRSFSAAAARELAKSPQAFESWLAGQLPTKLRLNEGLGAALASLREEAEELEDELSELEDSSSRSPRLKRKAANLRELLAAVKSDIKRLRSRSGKEAYRNLSVRVRALMERYHQLLSR